MKLTWIVTTALGVSAIALSGKAAAPLVIWNASASVPVGFHFIRRATPQPGDLALVRLQKYHSDYAHRRGYMTGTPLLLKPVKAIERARVCRFGTFVLVSQKIVARARLRDPTGRLMPAWSGCRTLKPGELFLISSADPSFDSRYIGVIGASQLVGTAGR